MIGLILLIPQRVGVHPKPVAIRALIEVRSACLSLNNSPNPNQLVMPSLLSGMSEPGSNAVVMVGTPAITKGEEDGSPKFQGFPQQRSLGLPKRSRLARLRLHGSRQAGLNASHPSDLRPRSGTDGPIAWADRRHR